MRFVRLLRLAMGEAGESPLRLWPLAAGIALGVASWVFFSGFALGLGRLLQEKVAGSLPDRIRVASASTEFGPIQLERGLTEETVAACKAIPGVRAVFRQAHYPGPCQLFASYGGQSVVTDLIVEGVDPEQVADQIPSGQVFRDPGDGVELPVVLPEALVDVLNAGISSHTSLPTLSPSALIGKHFRLLVGSSSYQPGEHTEADCVIVGVTDQLGVTGPAIPMTWMQRHAKKPIRYNTLTLSLNPGQPIEPVLSAIKSQGLVAPGVEMAARINSLVQIVHLATAAFSGCILLLAGASISTGMALQIRQERWLLGLFRAVGATQRDIIGFILARSAILSLSGSLLGIVAGWLAGVLIDASLRHTVAALIVHSALFRPSLLSWALALTCGLAAGLLSAVWPARQAAAMLPSQALRGD